MLGEGDSRKSSYKISLCRTSSRDYSGILSVEDAVGAHVFHLWSQKLRVEGGWTTSFFPCFKCSFAVLMVDIMCLLKITSVKPGHVANWFLIGIINLVFTGKNSAVCRNFTRCVFVSFFLMMIVIFREVN